MPMETVNVVKGDKMYVALYTDYLPERVSACSLGVTKDEALGRLLTANGEFLAFVDGRMVAHPNLVVLCPRLALSSVTVTATGMLAPEKVWEERRL